MLIEPNDMAAPRTFHRELFGKLMLVWWSRGRGIRSILREKLVTPPSYEERGNYVYSISKREIEKVALGLNLGAVAFKGLNDYYVKGVEYEKATMDSKLFRRTRLRIAWYNLQTKLNLKPYGLLSAMIFKEKIKQTVRSDLAASGYQVVVLPQGAFPSDSN